MGSTALSDQCNFGTHPMARNANFSQYAGIPLGTQPPYCWHPPCRSGMMASFTDISEAMGTADASLAAGINIEASLNAVITTDLATLDKIVNLLADLAASISTTDATLAAVAGLSVSISASGSLTTTDLGAIVSLLVNLSASGNLVANNFATALIEANITTQEELSPSSLAAAVWNAEAASFNEAGSMGEKLNDSGSSSNPLNAIIEGTLTLADIMRILLAVQTGKTSIIDNGGGSATVTFRDVADTKNRVEADMQDSERIDVTLDGG